jgi:mannosyl-oligosaccharide alpha-1,2-mannosidase
MRLFNCACLVSLLYHTNLFVNALPHIAHAAAKPVDSDQTRANAVKNAFLHAWSGYSQFAYGHDELLPVNNKFSDSR